MDILVIHALHIEAIKSLCHSGFWETYPLMQKNPGDQIDKISVLAIFKSITISFTVAGKIN